MAIHEEIAEINHIVEIDDPVGLLIDFYLGNGYDFDPHAPQSDPSNTEEQSSEPTRLVRGKRGNGWWSSNMTELHTQVVIQPREDALEIAYTVDVSGQILKDEERAFWTRERQAAEKYLREPSALVPDLRIIETARADKKSNSFFSFGLWGGVVIFMIIIFLGFVGVI